MASIMIGVAGVAQQLKTANASGGSAPTGVRIQNYAPGGSGNNSAVLIGEREPFTNPFDYTGAFNDTVSSTPAHAPNISVATLASNYFEQALTATIEFGGYCNVTDATGCTFAWDVSINSSSLSNGNSAAITGTASTSQNSLAMGAGVGDGVGEKLAITFGGSKSGVLYPANGDSVQVTISCTVTNSGGSTSDSVIYQINFVA